MSAAWPGPRKMPTSLTLLVLLLVTAGLIPLAVALRARVNRSPLPRVHLIWHMDNQERFKAQQACDVFPDGRASREPVPGAVARGELQEDPHYWRGIYQDDLPPEGENLVAEFPAEVLPLTEAFLRRGQERYDIFCAVCHGRTGDGQGTTHRRALEKEQFTWVPPRVLYGDDVADKRVGDTFHTISAGFQAMQPYGSQIPVADRWAIVAYVEVLQRAHRSTLEDLTAAERERLLAEPFVPPEPPPEEPGDEPPGDGEPGDEPPGDEPPGDEPPGDGEPGDGEPGDGEPGDGEPGDGEPGDGEPGDGEQKEQER